MKNYIWIASFFLLLSCKDVNKGDIYFYKLSFDDPKINDYVVREYKVTSDTLTELEVNINPDNSLHYKIKLYLKNKGDLFLILKSQGETVVAPYLSTSKIDSCNTILDPYMNYKICYEGKMSYLKNQEAYKMYYSEVATDGLQSTIFLDNDFRVIDIIYDNAIADKQTRVKESEVPKKIRNTLKEALSSYWQYNN